MTREELRDWMATMGLNNNQAAKLLGVNRSAVGHWLSGLNPIPKWAELAMKDKLKLKELKPTIRHDSGNTT